MLQKKLNKREKWQTKKGLMVIDFRQKDGSLFQYGVTTSDDQVMGGSSQANTQFDEVSKGFSVCSITGFTWYSSMQSSPSLPQIPLSFNNRINLLFKSMFEGFLGHPV